MIQTSTGNEWENHSADAFGRPHDSIRQSFSMYEPLIQIQGCGAEHQPVPNGTDDSLRDNQMPHCLRKRGEKRATDAEYEADIGAVFLEVRVPSENGE